MPCGYTDVIVALANIQGRPLCPFYTAGGTRSSPQQGEKVKMTIPATPPLKSDKLPELEAYVTGR
jgi:hypothetical protein